MRHLQKKWKQQKGHLRRKFNLLQGLVATALSKASNKNTVGDW